MSHSTQTAIHGMAAAEADAHERCMQAIERYAHVRTRQDLDDVYAWAKQHDWFFRSAADETAMRSADVAARRRIAKAERDARFPKLSRVAQQKAEEVVAFMRTRHTEIRGAIVNMMWGNYDQTVVRVHEIARWIGAKHPGTMASFFMQAIAKCHMDAEPGVTRAAFLALSPEEQTALVELITTTVAQEREDFFRNFAIDPPTNGCSR